MESRKLASLVLSLTVSLGAGEASAALFGVIDLGGNTYEVTLNGEVGDATTILATADLQSIEIFGSTLVSHDPTSSIFLGDLIGPTSFIVSPSLFTAGGSDVLTGKVFNSASVLPLGQFTLSGVPTDIRLTASGLFDAGPASGEPLIHISQTGGESLLAPEPGSALLLGLGLCAFAGRRRRPRRASCASEPGG